ncbi:uncharacterized protein LOC106473656 isoform X1 [Limulus polyphemus]|uniref:Uncharacterized protein LOC106473656 isoform X1 n=1 Tax=Limulus polyphemus TaxID=6850 RepID=A0ABM1BW28_LIMPO|nr:uncharacterized protein LOC106473656 isoform X1 [Limulus polyphemus]
MSCNKTERTIITAWIVHFLFSLRNGTESLAITSLSVPHLVENGTREYVDLDCIYNFTEEDEQLVVKWYHNEDPNPIYQWIPELNSRRFSEKFQDRVDTSFFLSPSDNFTKYRGLRILNPTTEISGKYSCHVASLNGIDDANKDMIVYAPGKRIKFNYTKTSSEVATFTCEVDQIYPQPQVTLVQMAPGKSERKLLQNTPTKTEKNNGSYRVLLTKEIKDSDLPLDGATTFECVILIPQTNYQKHSSIVYHPGTLQAAAVGDGSPAGAPRIGSFWIPFLVCLVWLVRRCT